MLIEKLQQRFGAGVLRVDNLHGEETAVIARDRAPEIFRALHDDPEFAFEQLIDVTAVDWPARDPRFDVVYHLNSISRGHRLRVKVEVPAQDAWMPTVHPLWKSADWLERECFDMFGIEFRGHPDLRRILLYDSFAGHPLRKDYPYQKRQPIVAETDPVTKPLRSTR
jgi:NADH-quinone oxidoreductase subunit C